MLVGRRGDGYEIDTDPDRLDLDRLHTWLSTDAYWALGRSRDTVVRAVANSVSFGLYHPHNGLCGFARAVTDEATFAYLCDVYVDRAVRGGGLGTWFVGAVCEHLRSYGPRRLMLATHDAHGLYRRFGFTELTNPEHWMEAKGP